VICPRCPPYNHAIDEDDLPIERNPARKLAKSSKGRADSDPPTAEEFDRLLDACSALGDYGPTMRAMFKFAAFTLMRPGEVYALDIDFKAGRIQKARRVYEGQLAEPKTGPKEIALTPPARDALMALDRDCPLVFPAKRGGMISASGMSGYWGKVLAAAGLDFEFYLASKHYGVWFMWTQLEMSKRAIAAQAGWSLRTVDKMLATYGHGEVGALDEVDAAFASHKPNLRVVGGQDLS
jgi:integrase